MSWRLLAVAALGIVAGVSTALWWQSRQTIPEPRPDFSLPDLDGHERAISEWDGRLVLVNFWATWCTPCLKEIPLLIAAQTEFGERGLQIVGPALDDADVVQDFVQAQRINYPVLLGQERIIAAMDALGDTLGGLPFTVLINRDGLIVERHWGALSDAQLRDWISAHL